MLLTILQSFGFVILFTILSSSLHATNLKIASYNVENLFDMKNNGTEYKAYKPNKHNWTERNFQKKLLNISEVVCDINADIIALQEIENEEVLILLKRRLRSIGCAYKYHAITHKKKSAVQVAMLSKIPIQNIKEIKVHIKLKYRHILETRFMIDNKALYIFNNHWSSKRSKESTRIRCAKALKQRIEKLPKNSQYILLGDFNNDYDEYLHLEPKHNNMHGKTAINHVLKSINKEGTFVRKNTLSTKVFSHYNLWLELENYKRWSHNFYGKKQALDAILLPHTFFDAKNFDYVKNSFRVFKRNYLFHKKGYIFRWEYKHSKHRGKGYSDHLPIVAEFSTTQHYLVEKSNFKIGSITMLYQADIVYPILLKSIKVIWKEKNKVMVKEKKSNKKILIYGTEEQLMLNQTYDIMVYKSKIYKGQYEIVDFEIEKRYDAI